MVSTEKDLEEDWTQLPQDLNLHKIKLKFLCYFKIEVSHPGIHTMPYEEGHPCLIMNWMQTVSLRPQN